MKRLTILLVTVTLLFSAASADTYAGAPVPMKIMLNIKPDISVELNGVRMEFRDVTRQRVYPIIYKGTTYLPVRAVSALMREPVEWDSGYKTVFIGKTLAYPDKAGAPIPAEAAVTAYNDEKDLPEPSLVTGYLKPDVLVMYDFDFQTFQDVKGNTVHPIIYNGSTYLPIRAVANLMDAAIQWDGTTKIISIEAEMDEAEEDEQTEEPEEEISAASLQLKKFFESEEILYYEATKNITSLQSAASLEDKQRIAAYASESYLNAQSLSIEIKETEQIDFTEEEMEAYEKLVAFAESSEYYLLVLENIAYMAASDLDYSMLAETFLYYAGEAKTKMDEAGEFIRFLTVEE